MDQVEPVESFNLQKHPWDAAAWSKLKRWELLVRLELVGSWWSKPGNLETSHVDPAVHGEGEP